MLYANYDEQEENCNELSLIIFNELLTDSVSMDC